ncbi:MAG TPA: alpha/beta hydrolase [Candidatus Binataceae bacterium]|nr:alpha/beta hydrolase [Candidatus Binataceae bacterium]
MADSMPAPHPSDSFIEANGLRLHYLDFGGDGRPWLVCIHGLSGNAHNFDPIVGSLSRRFHVISIDVRGRGDSAWGPPTEYLPKHYVEDLAAILGQLGVTRTTLIGTSMGGIISMMYAGGWPERVERLVLNDIGPEIDPAGAARIGSYMGIAPDRFNDLGEVAAYYRKTYPATAAVPENELRESVKWSVKQLAGGGLGWKLDPAIRRPIRGATAQQRLDLWVPFARITCPILVVRGADSDILSRRTAAQMGTTHAGVTIVEVAGVAHAPSLAEPEAAAALAKFLEL